MRTDPLSSAVHDHLGFMKLVAGRFDEALDHFARAHALDPNLQFLDQHLVRALTFAGRFSEALSLWENRDRPKYRQGPLKTRLAGSPGSPPPL